MAPVRATRRRTRAAKEEAELEKEEDEAAKVEDDAENDYEALREERMRKNRQVMESLNLVAAAERLKALKPKPQQTKAQTKRPAPSAEPLRRSLRTRNIAPPDGADGSAAAHDTVLAAAEDPREKRLEGPVSLTLTVNDLWDDTSLTRFVAELPSRVGDHSQRHDGNNDKSSDWDISAVELRGWGGDDNAQYLSQHKSFKWEDVGVRKVVPERIYSLTLHPSAEKVLAVAGDKWGRIGFFDISLATHGGDTDVVLTLKPHSQPVTQMTHSRDGSKLYSVSYDGTVRCLDYKQPVFHEVRVMEEWLTSVALREEGSNDTLYVGANNGDLHIIDVRLWSASPDTNSHHEYKQTALVRHNNNTGRYVTPFRAQWDPRSRDESSRLVLGNMDRSVDVISGDGKKIASLTSPR
eukprot:jgi/Chlat1/5776/Chrsp387S05496